MPGNDPAMLSILKRLLGMQPYVGCLSNEEIDALD